MIVEDSQIVPHSLTEIFNNPEQRQRILKIIIQTLYNLGFEQSAIELEAESKVVYLTPQVKALKAALPLQKYEEVELIVRLSPKYSQISDVLNELKCLKMIREGKMEEALDIIQNSISNIDKRNQLSQQLMFGTGELGAETLKQKHKQIIQACFDPQITPNSMLKMINCYVELQKKGLTASISPEFSLLKNSSQLKGPPARLIQNYTSSQIKSVCFIKFNRFANKVLILSSKKNTKFACIFNLKCQKNEICFDKSCSFSVNEDIVNASWNYDRTSQLVAIATCTHIFLFSADFQLKNKKKIVQSVNFSSRVLGLNWNPLTNLLYVCGAFDTIKVIGQTLEQIVTIQPFMRTRNIYFNQEGTHMFAVSSTKGLFSYYNLFEQKQEANFTTTESITSFRLENRGKNIVLVTQKKILYLAVCLQKPNKFQILYEFNNIYSQNGLVEIQAYLYGQWIVCLGNRQFTAFSIDKNIKKQFKWNSKDAFTFDISGQFMVTGLKQISLWSRKTFRDQNNFDENQNQIQEQIFSVPVPSQVNFDSVDQFLSQNQQIEEGPDDDDSIMDLENSEEF